MQLPSLHTPVNKCIELAQYTETALTAMSDKYSELSDLHATLTAAREQTQTAVDQTQSLIAQRKDKRVASRMADLLADEGIRNLKRAAESAQGMEGGYVSVLFPDGMSPMVRLQGVSQIGEMKDLEHRLAGLEGWAGASDEAKKLAALRESYEQAVDAQAKLEASIRKSIIERESAKANLVTVFDQVARSIQIRFPRNRRMQDVFFDRFRTRRVEIEEDETDTPDGSGAA